MKTTDKILRANKIYDIHKCWGQKSSNKEAHARKRKGKTVVSEDLSGGFLIKDQIKKRFLTKKAPGETSTGKTVISQYQTKVAVVKVKSCRCRDSGSSIWN